MLNLRLKDALGAIALGIGAVLAINLYAIGFAYAVHSLGGGADDAAADVAASAERDIYEGAHVSRSPGCAALLERMANHGLTGYGRVPGITRLDEMRYSADSYDIVVEWLNECYRGEDGLALIRIVQQRQIIELLRELKQGG